MKRLEALVPLGVGRVLLTTESDTGLGAVDVAVLNSVNFLTELPALPNHSFAWSTDSVVTLFFL